jgi:hypothetical protein
MSSSLNETVKKYSNKYLIEQLYLGRDQYTDEAIKILEEEISLRAIGREEIDSVLSEDKEPQPEETVHYDKKDFTLLEGAFTTNDSLLVRSMLAQHKVPSFADNSAALLPFTGEELDAHLVKFYIHNDFLETARTVIAEHYDLVDNRYNIKYNDIKTRLKSFNFYEIPHYILESKELVDVEFTPEEKELLITYGSRLIAEVDAIESTQERVVFYYDSIEDFIESLKSEKKPHLTRNDLLTALEILQIYCDDANFPDAASSIIEALLNFFSTSSK